MEFSLLSTGTVSLPHGDVEVLKPVKWQAWAIPFRQPFSCMGGSGNFQVRWISVPYY